MQRVSLFCRIHFVPVSAVWIEVERPVYVHSFLACDKNRHCRADKLGANDSGYVALPLVAHCAIYHWSIAMRLNFALPLLAASFCAALDALPPRDNPVSTSLHDTGDQVSGSEPSRIDGDERNSGQIAESAAKLVEDAQKLADGSKNRISSVLSKILNKKVRTWSEMDPATLGNLVAHKAIMQSYNELARKDISEAEMVSE